MRKAVNPPQMEKSPPRTLNFYLSSLPALRSTFHFTFHLHDDPLVPSTDFPFQKTIPPDTITSALLRDASGLRRRKQFLDLQKLLFSRQIFSKIMFDFMIEINEHLLYYYDSKFIETELLYWYCNHVLLQEYHIRFEYFRKKVQVRKNVFEK